MRAKHRASSGVLLGERNTVSRSILRHSNSKPPGARNARKTPAAAAQPIKAQPDPPAQPSKVSRNRANTIRNSVKVEHYLMEVEKVHGFAKSWALRERLEQGHISFDELTRR